MQQALKNKPTQFEKLCIDTQKEQQELLDVPVINQAMQGNISRDTYIAFLTQAYHHVKHTVPLLMYTGSRISHQDEWLRSAMAEYIEEEIGHEKWILNDIKAAGGNPTEVSQSEPAFATEMMVAYAYDSISRKDPLTFLGMVHVLEGTSVALATKAANTIKDSLSLPNNAFTYLYSHGDLDQDHQKFFQDLINRMTDSQVDIVIHSAIRFYQLYANIFKSLS
ncbi:iron-containing redox enzyme family protein [Marinicella sp. S1101]|uniref:TenA family transcriptional regulator n=1 Tax=Marinicella marina TaxID=2996016 RepID=UPI00226086D7|nr:iron-containing redox enzyme family protein [Marinicella marina]MCX7554202.1 iron-containing redox enzyme family protein [Marinicella marina]MDJ1141105.1 iron-containing redox enzyme family protein [Marinicella marina]